MINVRMNAPTEPSSKNKLSPKIIVVGVGGAGCNAVNNMITTNVKGVNFLVCNTDAQALNGNLAEHKVQLGAILTEGLGAGAKPEIGRAAAEESLEDVMQYLEDANMAFITAGMGGGTGTGAASVIAKACRERGILTVGVVTKPFHFEGSRRMKMAEEGLSELQNYVDTLIIIPNQNLFRVVNDKTTFSEGFKMADSVLQSAVRGVTDLIVMPGLINLDFADIRSVMQEMGKAVMGAGEATGDNRAQEAAEKAISNPLLDDVSMKGAKGVIVNITGGYDMTLFEVDEACNRIRDEVDPDANIIFGSTFDETLEGTIRVSVVATGIESAEDAQKRTNNRQSSGGFQVDRTKPMPSAPLRSGIRGQDSTATQHKNIGTMAPASSAISASANPAAPSQSTPINAYSQERQIAMAEQNQMRQAVGFDLSNRNNDTAIKGTRMGESYIPPQPADPNMMGAGSMASAYNFAPVTAPRSATPSNPQTISRAQSAEESNPYAHISSQAPAQNAVYQQTSYAASAPPASESKSLSLFDRITGGRFLRQGGSRSARNSQNPAVSFADPQNGYTQPGAIQPSGLNVTAPSDLSTGRVTQAATPTAGLRASPRGTTGAIIADGTNSGSVPTQGRLNIDTPAAPSREEDELEIPTFLRRQTS